MATRPATRMDLLAARRELALAEQGQLVLEEKRAALLREMMKMAGVALLQADELDRAAAAARDALDLAKALDGPEAVRSAAFAATSEGGRFELAVEGAIVFGVPVPLIRVERERRQGLLDRGYSLPFSSARIDHVAATFEEELHCLVHLAETEAGLRRVGEEIQQTSRRANVLRVMLIPGMQREVRRIAAALAEREREDHFRLKRLKRGRS